MTKDKKTQDRAMIHFTDGSQQEVYCLDWDTTGANYLWEHEGKELHSFVPYAAIKRIDYLHED